MNQLPHPQAVFVALKPPVPSVASAAARRKDDGNLLLAAGGLIDVTTELRTLNLPADPSELAKRARALRRLLDDHGFTACESHLNEWNFLPGSTWKPISRTSSFEARQTYYQEMAGERGAAFIVAALLELQDAPVDVCNLFHGELGGFGLFNEHGVPEKNSHALRAFRGLLDTPRRVEIHGAVAGQLHWLRG